MRHRSMSGREEEEPLSLSLCLSVSLSLSLYLSHFFCVCVCVTGLSEVGELLVRLACCKVPAVPGDGVGWHGKCLISHLSVCYKGSNPTSQLLQADDYRGLKRCISVAVEHFNLPQQ